MALPIIIVDSTAVGSSDTLASGAGPGDGTTGGSALTGTAASTDGTGLIVTLDGSPDLTNVATDGSHVIFLNHTAGRNFGKITAKDNTAKTVTVANAFTASLSGKTWAIGGKRASLFSNANSQKLVTADLLAGWIAEFQSGHSESYTGTPDSSLTGNTTDGSITIRGAAGAAIKPIVTHITGTPTQALILRNGYWVWQDFEFRRGLNGATSGITLVIGGSNNSITFQRMTFRSWTGNVLNSSSAYNLKVLYCEFDTCGRAIGTTGPQNGIFHGNFVHDGVDGIDANGVISGWIISENIFARMSDDAIKVTNTRVDTFGSCHICNNIIHSCGGDGIEYAGAPNTAMAGISITGNIISGCTGIGLSLSHASSTAFNVGVNNPLIDRNAFYNNTSHRNNVNAGPNDVTLTADPFENAAGGDFNINDTPGGGLVLRQLAITMPG